MTNKNQHPNSPEPKSSGATLAGEGVDKVFGYPGGAILPAYDALRKFPIHHILVRHEQGAAHMADGYARASGKVGVCIATSGPGATNLVTGIATAMLDSIPIVAITARSAARSSAPTPSRRSTSPASPCPSPAQLPRHPRRRHRPRHPRGTPDREVRPPRPVLVDITKDAQQAAAPFNFEAAAPKPYRPHPMLRAESSSIQQAIELIKAAKKPSSSRPRITHSGAEAQVLAVHHARTAMQMPVASTLLGVGISLSSAMMPRGPGLRRRSA